MTFTTHDYPILEFDAAKTALIEPRFSPLERLPEQVVLCFFQEAIAAAAEQPNARLALHLNSEIGRNPVYVLQHEGREVALVHPGVGAPLAAGFLEEVIALGGRKFIAVGGAGVLRPDLTVGHAIVPTAALRDEGTSYHYLPPARTVAPSPEAVAALEAVLTHHHMPYVAGTTWTTDALYRETPARIAARRAEGCICVEMEAAAFCAVAQFRGVTFGQLLYGGDDLSGDAWDHRDWIRSQANTRMRLLELGIEACMAL